jgi:hypothetical protein
MQNDSCRWWCRLYRQPSLRLDVKDVFKLAVLQDNYSTGFEDNYVANVKYIKCDIKNINSLVTFSPDLESVLIGLFN